MSAATEASDYPAPPPEFIWEVPLNGDGYEVVMRRREEKAAKVEPMLQAKPGARFRTYQPLREEPALFRNLAEVEPTADGVLAFANRYGRLGRPVEVAFPMAMRIERAEPLAAWDRRVGDLREAVEVWEAARSGDQAMLSRLFAWDENGSVVNYLWERPPGRIRLPNMPAIASRHQSPELLASFQPGDLTRPALVWLARSLSDWMSSERLASPVLAWDPSRDRVTFEDRPWSLFGAAYLQLAWAVATWGTTREKQYRRCAVCSRWFEIAPPASRNTRQTCSDACRVRLYRDRRERARELYVEGKTPAAIVKELGADLETVKGWVKDLKRGSR